MRHSALTVIHEEHQALAAMLRSMQLLVAQAQREHHAPDFSVLRAMLLYVDEFPERLHHPKETDLLFKRLRQTCPELQPTLDQLDRDHARGEAAVRELSHTLMAWEVLGEPRRQAFADALDGYVKAYLHHMSVEETAVLPLARERLSDGDWALLDAAFAENRDPLTGHSADAVYAPLFKRIVMTAPAPVGLG